jgi:ribosomal protein S18 acetylase RimI-like enzyme
LSVISADQAGRGCASGTPVAEQLTQRPAAEGDDDFLRAVFAESRPDLALLPEPVRAPLLRMQFDSQRSQYRSSSPGAIDWILEVEREPVGRCYLWSQQPEHRLLDLAISRRWRRMGLGHTVLERLQSDAAAAGVPLRLSVWRENEDALRLYRRLGFVADRSESHSPSASAGYLSLRWTAGAPR